jgi:predicted ArsR family transcriptional regulator
MQKTNLSKQTAHNHLKHLIRDGVLTRKAVIQGKGRPTIYYRRTSKPLRQVKGEVVSITFNQLKKLCKKRQSDYCQEKNKECDISICPAILK